ncbi:hypothetical protein RM530_18190 [Algiphilus sp. W345]|uniref:Uncharacterized protein n=1 Tax=Banduia mediterranea TaxID=3075609 RepID=A0ABU2WN27_9GAMM|nr:hypothetical protein [Algiphilus sp. W345]MDT0499275.1 hypothetical protein [Algiphilus sp. W345]
MNLLRHGRSPFSPASGQGQVGTITPRVMHVKPLTRTCSAMDASHFHGIDLRKRQLADAGFVDQ